MSNRCKPVRRHIRATEFIPDDTVDMASFPGCPKTGVTKVTAVRATQVDAGDMAARTRSNAQFLHNLRAVPAPTWRGVGRGMTDLSVLAVIRGG